MRNRGVRDRCCHQTTLKLALHVREPHSVWCYRVRTSLERNVGSWEHLLSCGGGTRGKTWGKKVEPSLFNLLNLKLWKMLLFHTQRLYQAFQHLIVSIFKKKVEIFYGEHHRPSSENSSVPGFLYWLNPICTNS